MRKTYNGKQATEILLACRRDQHSSQLEDFSGSMGDPCEDFRINYVFSIRNPPIAVCVADRGDNDQKTVAYLIGNKKDIIRFEQKLSIS